MKVKKQKKKIEFEVIKNEVYLDAETLYEIEWDKSPRTNKIMLSDLNALIEVLNGELFNQFTLGMVTFKSNEYAQIFKTALDIYFGNERSEVNEPRKLRQSGSVKPNSNKI